MDLGHGGQTQPLLIQPGGSNLKSHLYRSLRQEDHQCKAILGNLMLKPLGPDQYAHQRFGVAAVCCYFIYYSPVNGKSVERKMNQRREWAPRDVGEA